MLVGWIIGSTPQPAQGQGTLAAADLLTTTLVAGLFGVALGALVGALWGLNIPGGAGPTVISPQPDEHDERVVPLDYAPPVARREPGVPGHSPFQRPTAQTSTPYRNVLEGHEEKRGGNVLDETNEEHGVDAVKGASEEAVMADRQQGRNQDNITGTEGAFDPETGAYGTAGTPVTTGYGVSGSTIGTGSHQVQDEHEAGDFAGSTPDSASYEMGGRGSQDTPTPARPDDSSNTPVVEKNSGSMAAEAPAQSEPRTRDIYEGSAAYGPGAAQDNSSSPRSESSHNSDASLDVPPSSKTVNSEEKDASAGTNITGTDDQRGLGDNTDRT